MNDLLPWDLAGEATYILSWTRCSINCTHASSSLKGTNDQKPQRFWPVSCWRHPVQTAAPPPFHKPFQQELWVEH